MRFTANGPDISDELLNARDQGRVVFICGAGVSRARAGLPDFWGLAEKVASALGILPEEKIFQIIQSAKKPKADGFISISADRLFGMLEQDFEIEDIYSAVSGALKHDVDCDLAAHQILIDLATTREGLVRIVTTNFDLLFEACNTNLLSHVPPKLPDPKRPKEFNGIVYLHGRVDDGYFGAKADGFVLSSSEFGQAYLADGWATRFIKEILNNYIVVFVGYSADDPPIQYLLEALKKDPAKRNDIYAFHALGNDGPHSHWIQKGVIPIEYNEASQHRELWDTLEAWALRARDPVEWSKGVVREALKGPEGLEPHIRGQVAHLVSSYEGMKYFCGDEAVPPSEWLAVFDPHIRLENISKKAVPQDSIVRSNIDKYGLDGESLSEIDPTQRKVIDPNAWNAFSLNHQDFISAKPEHFNVLIGDPKSDGPYLLPRLGRFSWWISKVCGETYAIEWALNQNFLHPILCKYISQSINDKNRSIPSVVCETWRYILESKSKVRDESGIYEIARQIADEGWSNRIVRRFANFHAPWISTAPTFRNPSRPVGEVNALGLRDLVRLEVECGHLGRPAFDIPNEWLASVIAAFRPNLQSAIQLEIEINGPQSYYLQNIVSLHVENPDENSYARNEGLSGLVYFYSKLLNTLISIDRSAAIKEVKSWSTIETTVLAHLNIWIASKSEIISITEFLSIIQSLSNDDFWIQNNQRDLLITLSSRWHELDAASKTAIEKIILIGPDNWGCDPIQFQTYSAHRVLERLHWLNASGCQLSIDIDEVTENLTRLAPKWTNEDARDAASSNEVRVRTIDKNCDYSVLHGLSLNQILPVIEQLSVRSRGFIDNDPFQGLMDDKPVLALRVLTLAAKNGVFPARLWEKFLSSSGRQRDGKAFVRLVCLRIASYEPEQLILFLNSITRWISSLNGDQFRQSHDSLISTISKVIQTMGAFPEDSGSSYVRSEREPDWMMESMNSPVGQIIESMFLEPDVIGAISEIPTHWLSRVDLVLGLPGDLQRHALVLLNKNLLWFYHHNPEWTETALWSQLNSTDALTKNAAWAGLLWSNNFTNDRFYKRLKPLLMEVLNSNPVTGQKKRLAEMLLSGWASIDSVISQRYVSDAELTSILIRSDDQFREAILSSANRWARSEESQLRWQPRLMELIALWPRRKALKSANVTNCFLSIALKEKEQFPEVVRLILPLVSKSEQRSINIFDLTYGEMDLIEKHPMEVLNLIHTVLPSDVHRWPYEIGSILARLQSANSELINDERLIELNRLWDSR